MTGYYLGCACECGPVSGYKNGSTELSQKGVCLHYILSKTSRDFIMCWIYNIFKMDFGVVTAFPCLHIADDQVSPPD